MITMVLTIQGEREGYRANNIYCGSLILGAFVLRYFSLQSRNWWDMIVLVTNIDGDFLNMPNVSR